MTSLPLETDAAHRRIQDRAHELMARGWHGPYFDRNDLVDLAIDRGLMRLAAKRERR